MNSAEDWDFRTWRATLAALPPRSAALIGLAAAERLAGCLRDPRIHRYPDQPTGLVDMLLDRCWAALALTTPDDGLSQEIRELIARVENFASEYDRLSMTDLFHSYEPFDETDESDGSAEEPDLDEFLDEAVPEGAVALHLDALRALTEAALACSGGPRDGALRSLQTVTFAVHGRPDRMEAESRCQQRDLATVQALASAESGAVAEASRTEARAEADQWQKTTEQLALFRG